MKIAGPVDRATFAAAMARLGPFESHPHVACAVSGGADSMALVMLAEAWAKDRGGRATALIVDHGLRRESAAEAQSVGAQLRRRGIPVSVLVRSGDRPPSNVQARVREDRYRLLTEWCRGAGVLHLLLGHHRDDQAETFLLRLGRASGGDGLAAMAAVTERPEVRLLRPLLGISKAALISTCGTAEVEWVEDPSNEDDAFDRVRVRRLLPSLADAGIGADELANAASRFAGVRAALEHSTARALARVARIHPAGFAMLDRHVLRSYADEIAFRVLGAVIRAVGGGGYPPNTEALERLCRKTLAEGPLSSTLGGCRVMDTGAGLLICRELRRPGPQALLAAPGRVVWDGRFAIELKSTAGSTPQPARIAHLGSAGWQEIVRKAPEMKRISLPKPVVASLPALFDEAGVAFVPHLDFKRPKPCSGLEIARVGFRPPNAVAPAGFFYCCASC